MVFTMCRFASALLLFLVEPTVARWRFHWSEERPRFYWRPRVGELCPLFAVACKKQMPVPDQCPILVASNLGNVILLHNANIFQRRISSKMSQHGWLRGRPASSLVNSTSKWPSFGPSTNIIVAVWRTAVFFSK